MSLKRRLIRKEKKWEMVSRETLERDIAHRGRPLKLVLLLSSSWCPPKPRPGLIVVLPIARTGERGLSAAKPEES